MPSSRARFALYCDAVQSRYLLAYEGEDWSESFPSLHELLQRASDLTYQQLESTACREPRPEEESITSTLPANGAAHQQNRS